MNFHDLYLKKWSFINNYNNDTVEKVFLQILLIFMVSTPEGFRPVLLRKRVCDEWFTKEGDNEFVSNI